MALTFTIGYIFAYKKPDDWPSTKIICQCWYYSYEGPMVSGVHPMWGDEAEIFNIAFTEVEDISSS